LEMCAGSLPQGNMPENSASTKELAFASPTLSFFEVKALVEKIAPKVLLKFDGDVATGNVASGQKGRYLVASRAIQAGEVVLSERPLFQGSTEAERSRKVYSQDFLAKLETSEDNEEEDFEDDCFHPRSPLVDCVAGVLLSKKNAASPEDVSEAAYMRLRQLGALSRAAVKQPVPDGAAEDLFAALPSDIQALTSEEELHGILHILSSNRFGNTSAAGIDLMFAGSMFEHSCAPNCFVGSVLTASGPDAERSYRALRDVAEGEALSIDYLLLPDSYFPTSERLQILSGWGFACKCQRCTNLVEIERSFICPACNEHELCPRGAGPSCQDLLCRSCGQPAEASYASRCFAREASLLPKTDEGEDSAGTETAEEADSGFLGKYHYLVFQALWAQVAPGVPEDPEDWPGFLQALEALIAAVARLYENEQHPLLLDLFHLGALVTQSTSLKGIEAQGSYLIKEHAVLQRYYPEEAARQDAEIMALVQGKGPWTEAEEQAQESKPEEPSAQTEDSGLGEMD